jgi:hypothetical protein
MEPDIRKYTFVIAATISMHIEVVAESLEEAVEAAQSAAPMSLCHQCARGSDVAWSTSGELDFEPSGAELVAVSVNDEGLSLEEIQAVNW